MRLAVLVERVRLDAEQVLPGQLRLDALERVIAAVDHVEQRAARRAGEHLDADRLLQPILEPGGRFGGARLGDLEDLLVELHHVDAGARGRGEVVDLHERRVLIVEHEALGDEHEGVRRIHGPQRREQVAERVDGLLAVEGADRRDRVGLVLDRPEAHLDARELARRRRLRIAALALLHPQQDHAVAAPDGHRFGNRDLVEAPRHGLALAGRQVHRLAQPLAIGREGHRGRARADADQRDAIGRLEAIDEAVDRPANAEEPAEPDIRLIDDQQDQPPAGTAFVRGVAFRRRRRLGPFRRRQRDPVGADHPPRAAVEADAEVFRLQSQDRPPAVVDHRHVHRGEVDARAEPRLILRVLRGSRAGGRAPTRRRRSNASQPSVLFPMVMAVR